MADARARDGHTSDCRTTSAIVCVCACRLPLKMQVWPATSGVKDTPKRYVHGVAACDCGSHLSSQQRALGSRGSGSLRSGAQSSVTHGSWVRDGTALGLQVCSWEVKKERGATQMSVRPRILPYVESYKGSFANVVTCTRHTKTRNTYRVTQSPQSHLSSHLHTSWAQTGPGGAPLALFCDHEVSAAGHNQWDKTKGVVVP